MEIKQTCRFCENPNSILTKETCCSGCSKIPNPYQPERSKREDSLIREMMESSAMDMSKLDNDPPYPLVWDKDLNFIGHKVIEEMRCSELCGDVET